MQLTADQLEKVRGKQVANALAKLQAGKTLTAREEALLAGASGAAGYVATWEELAQELGLDRRTLQNARKRFARDAPVSRADGRKPVADWRAWAEKHGLRGRAGDAELVDERDVKLETAQLNLEIRRFEFEKAKDRMLPVAQFETALGVTLTNFRAALNAHPGRATGKILNRIRGALLLSLRARLSPTVYAKVDEALGRDGAIDFADVEEVLRSEVDLILRTLAECDCLQADPALE